MPCSHCHKKGHNKRTCPELKEDKDYHLQVIDSRSGDLLHLFVKKQMKIHDIIAMIYQSCNQKIIIDQLQWNMWSWNQQSDGSQTLGDIGILEGDCLLYCVQKIERTNEDKHYSNTIQDQKSEYEKGLEEDLEKQKQEALAEPSKEDLRKLRLQHFMK